MGCSTYFFYEPKAMEILSLDDNNTLNINIYSFKNRRIKSVSHTERQCVLGLKGKLLNDLPIIGSFCRERCILDDAAVEEDYIDYRFIFQNELVKTVNGKPTLVIRPIIIEGRHYLRKGLAAVLSNGEHEEKSAVSIMYAMEDYLRLSTNPGFEFIYTLPRYKPLRIDGETLKSVKEFFQERLCIEESNSEDCKINTVMFYPLECLCSDGQGVIKASLKSKHKALEFHFKDLNGLKKRIIIDEEGRMFSTLYIHKNTFEEIINYIFVIENFREGKLLMSPVDVLFSDYCSHIHKDMTEEGKRRLKLQILDEVKNFVDDALQEEQIKKVPAIIYLTLVANIAVRLTEAELQSSENELDLSCFSDFASLLQRYSRKKHIKDKQEETEKVMKHLRKLIISSKGYEQDFISEYKFLREK